VRRFIYSSAIAATLIVVTWAAASGPVASVPGGVAASRPAVLQSQAPAQWKCSDLEIGGTLPLPCTMPLADYEKILYRWVNDREYTRLGWAKDKEVRDTGPFVLNSNYGTHPAVRIYYSPEVLQWLQEGRPADRELPVGSMIVKEMFPPPAARLNEPRWLQYDEDPEGWENLVAGSVGSWTIMIKDGQTRDGWFWAGVGVVSRSGKTEAEYEAAIAATVDTNAYPFDFRDSAYGQASCLRCHSSAQSETTFIDLANIEGDGAVRFRVDASWRDDLEPEQRPGRGESQVDLMESAYHGRPSVGSKYDEDEILSQPLSDPDAEFSRYFQLVNGRIDRDGVKAFPGQWADHVPAGPDGAEQFITSDNCIGCHGGLGGEPYGITMFLQTGSEYGDGYNISPFGEWRWSPMGLAGRDPAFYSQLATELAILDGQFQDQPDLLGEAKNAVVNTCLSCHGGMGQRQLWIDVADNGADLDPNFKVDYVYSHTPLTREQKNQPHAAYQKYGNLAREGISCTMCHHIDPPAGWETGMPEDRKEEIFLMSSTTGQFAYSSADEINGPFADILVDPMQNALGITPGHNDYVEDSRLCGTCHTINLPNVDCPTGGDPADPNRCNPLPVLDRAAKAQARHLEERYGADYASFLADNFPHSIEQATYLEWKNSAFSDKADPGTYQTCQDCHMPREFKSLDGSIDIEQLTSQIASIQDSNYPFSAYALPAENLFVPFRSDYRRHELVGLNAFLVEMFDQFDPILGIAEQDYMTSAITGDELAVENIVRQAANDTVKLGVDVVAAAGRELTADVTVESLVGHRFPSGVSFRRAWIELSVLDGERGGELVWASGRTNSVGLIVDGSGTPLPTEFFEGDSFQPHFDTASPITREDQAQIYEEVTVNGDDHVTFSFIHRDEHLKDNRLLPKGWKPSGQFSGEVMQQFMEATDPEGVGNDPEYAPGNTGKDTVRYQITLPEGVDAAHATVRVRMFYQAFQPFWLKRKFELSGDDPATQRLYYLASHLNIAGTVIDKWKLPLVEAQSTPGSR
jgi:hypothetical protein